MTSTNTEESVRWLRQAFGKDAVADLDLGTLSKDNSSASSSAETMVGGDQAARRTGPSKIMKAVAGLDNRDSSSDSDGPTAKNSVSSTLAAAAAAAAKAPRAGYRHMLKRGDFKRAPEVNLKAAGEVQRSQMSEPLRLVAREISPSGWVFTPWEIVLKYPRHFVGNANRGPASPYFQAPAVLDNQIWDFFYVQPLALDEKPVLLVPVANVNHLLDYVNAALGIRLTVPVGDSAAKFNVQFGIGNTPRPRYLGRSASSADFDRLREELSSMRPTAEPLEGATGQAIELFRDLVDGLCRFSDNKNGAAKRKKKARQRVAARQQWGRATKRVQRYLGIRQKTRGRNTIPRAKDSNTGGTPDISGLTLKQQKPDIKLVCVDVETYERSHDLVTEIGFAELDTSRLRGIPPGDGCQNWFSLIQGSHYIIKENSWAKNGIHVEDNRRNYSFGTSNVVPLRTMHKIVEKTLGRRGLKAEYERSDEAQLAPVVLVGHDIAADIEHLQKIGYDARKAPRIVDVIDTAQMHQHWRREKNPASLGRVLAGLEISHRYLHNAGNDAMYTLQALLVLASKARQDSFGRTAGKKTARDTQSVDDSDGGWSTGGELSDGGDAVGLESERD
ncbi:hypothetical protein RB594_003007 [Gaeumannomyces avenae]